MKNERLRKYLPIFISIFMLVSLLGLILLGNFLLFTISSNIEDSYDYYKWNEWGFTFSVLKLFGVIALLVGWVAWIWLAILIERKLKIQIIHREPYDKYHLGTRSDFLRIIVRKKPSSTDETKSKD
jgi:hypothetical protein